MKTSGSPSVQQISVPQILEIFRITNNGREIKANDVSGMGLPELEKCRFVVRANDKQFPFIIEGGFISTSYSAPIPGGYLIANGGSVRETPDGGVIGKLRDVYRLYHCIMNPI